MHKNTILISYIFIFSLFVSSCNNKPNSVSEEVVIALQNDKTCSASVDLIWKSLYTLEEFDLDRREEGGEFTQNLIKEFKLRSQNNFLDTNKIEVFADEYSQFLAVIEKIKDKTKKDKWVKRLSYMQFSSLASGLSNNEIERIERQIDSLALKLDEIREDCSESVDNFGSSFVEELKDNNHPVVYGAKKVFLTAYQDCKLNNKKPLTRRSHGVEGVVELNETHPDGFGVKRIIGDKQQLYSTHHYYGYRPLTGRSLSSTKSGSKCLDQKKYLMIYDYAGKPAATIKDNSSLNMFKNAVKEASPDLGIDCSGFVFSALASAGLKLHPDKKMIAKHVFMVGANNFRTPDVKSNSIVYMPCLEKVKMDNVNNLKSGDIISTRFHTVIVGRVGKDPLGIKKAARYNNCNNISYKKFDYDVYHSDPGKGGIGIHHITARGQLATSSGMRKGLESLAKNICKNSRKGKKTLSRLFRDHKISIVRHKNTPECKGPEVSLNSESCLNECN